MDELAEGRRRLAVKVAADRGRIFRTVDKARIAANVARGTWEKVEAGQPVRDFSLAAIEEALGWAPGTALRIIYGDETAAPDATSSKDDLRRKVLETDMPPAVQRAMLALVDSLDHDEGRDSGQQRGSA